MNIVKIFNKLIQKQDLLQSETKEFFFSVLQGELDPIQIAGIITALRIKGETNDEILGFIRAMRSHMIPVELRNAIDVCGTGGDGKSTFNISTAVAFVVAGAEVKVAKHGNRAVSGKCGSADVLEGLGVNTQLKPLQAEEVFKKVGMVFLFAPLYHPAMKHVAGIRKSLGIRTIFNLLGPFTNPASVKRQLIGVPDKKVAERLAKTATNLNYDRLILVSSDDGFDEISIFAKTSVYEIEGEKIKKKRIDPSKYGFVNGRIKDIVGGSTEQNAAIIKQILNGAKGSARDIVVLNSAFALYASGKVSTIKEGIRLAEQAIDKGLAKQVLENLVKETQKYA